MQDSNENATIIERINNILSDDFSNPQKDSWTKLCNDLRNCPKDSDLQKASILVDYEIVFRILSLCQIQQLKDKNISKEIKNAFCSSDLKLSQEYANNCIEYFSSNNKSIPIDYLKFEYGLLINEICEFAVYSKELKIISEDLKAMGDLFFKNELNDSAYNYLLTSLQKHIKNKTNICNDNPSLRQRVVSVLNRLYALILSMGSMQKITRHMQAFRLSDAEIQTKLQNKFNNFFNLQKFDSKQPKEEVIEVKNEYL